MRSFGILTFAFGLNYAKHAYGLALSARAHGVQVAVATKMGDPACAYLNEKGVQTLLLTAPPMGQRRGQDREPAGQWFHSAFAHEQFAYDVSPFDLTLKMDADCLIPRDADMELIRTLIVRHQVVNGVPHTLTHEPVYSTEYREREVSWGLPTVYSTMFGFTRCAEAHLFYQHIKAFCAHWDTDALPMTKGIPMTTDTLYSMAWAACHNLSSALMGLPFHHMKPATVGWGPGVREDWTREVPYHVKGSRVYVGGQCVCLPMHYQDKNFMSDDVIKELEAASVRSI